MSAQRIGKVLLVHNFYQIPGGEDQVFQAEATLLEERGTEVVRYTVHNDAVRDLGPLELAMVTLWNRRTQQAVGELLRSERPDVVHVHNTFPLVSPSIHYAAWAAGVPIVQTLHNYRLICPMAEFYRDGGACEDCLGRVPWPGILHACYRNSRLASSGVAALITFHRALGTWRRKVARFIALTEFARGRFVAAGLPPERILVKPNFLAGDPGSGGGRGDYALYVGRLVESKGIDTLLAAWSETAELPPLKIVGEGPLEGQVSAWCASRSGAEWLGRRPRDEVLVLMRGAGALIFPSRWYEGFPMVIVEAFASGLPVVTSALGSMASIVEDRRTGRHFRTGDHRDLARVVVELMASPAERERLGEAARTEFESLYTADRNHALLMAVYREALSERFVRRQT